MNTLRLLLVSTALSFVIAGCPADVVGDDTGSPGMDTGRPAEPDAFAADDTGYGLPDAPLGQDSSVTDDAAVSPDAFVTADAAGATADDSGATADDSGTVIDDAGHRDDAASIGAGECDPTACTSTCFRPIRCVKACGGPRTECGCCSCATGSFDDVSCG